MQAHKVIWQEGMLLRPSTCNITTVITISSLTELACWAVMPGVS